MDISRNGLKFIMDMEGCVIKPYNDAIGYATIGVGHLIGKRAVTSEDKAKYANFTQQNALDLLKVDIATYVKSINSLLIVPVNQGQFDAMVSLAFNIGIGNFTTSSVLKYTNMRMFHKAQDSFALWNKAGGKVLAGLTRRRAGEAVMYGGKI